MLTNCKKLFFILPLILMAFTPAERDNIETENYYNLKFLKAAQAPREMKMLRTYNIAYHKQILEKGLLFTYHNRSASDVRIAGDFSNWGDRKMERGKFGVWYYFLNNCNKDKIRYKFLVDSIWIQDPKNPNTLDDGYGGYLSILYPKMNFQEHMVTYKILSRNTVMFRLFNPEARIISLVGDFNNWNPENDLLNKEEDGIWKLEKRLPKGTYKYKYIIDGKWSIDLYNERTGSDNLGGICSVIDVK